MAKGKSVDDLDLGVDQRSGSKKRFIIILTAVMLLLVAGAVAAWFLLATDSPPPGEQEATGQVLEDEASASRPALYHPFRPHFLANLEGRPKMLQVDIQVMTRDPELVEFLEQNDPIIRDKILSLLMAQQGSQLKQRAGKEALQARLLTAIQVLLNEHQAPGELEALYFTSFVMQ